VSDYLKDYRFELARNPYFSEPWSVAAVPTGYPDAIRWLKVDDVRAGVEAVDAGQADLVELTPLTDRSQTHTLVDDLLIRDPRQLHTGAVVGTTFVALNSSIPPFDSVQARQAVNYAVDRGMLVELSGGPSAAAPTCQLSLPGFPGHAPYCPYTTGTEDGRYHGPDLDTARRLIAESGTAGARVTVTDIVGDYSPAYDDYIGQVLRELGYQVTMEHLDNTDENQAHFSDPDSGIQVQSGGWLPDYPRPSTFYDALVRCPTELIPQAYVFGYCDPQTDLAADAALALQATDPGRALRAWANVQHTVTDKAPVVFGVTTRDVWYSSDRVGNYQQAEIYGPLFSQLWVR
jgi:peptide/nickel transport system substrate-binding protein